MVSSRKRGRQEMEEAVETPNERPLLDRIRNMWEFANLTQWIYTFGKAVKIDENLDIEQLEMELLKPHSTVLPEIGLALLKFVSSHRGLTLEIFDEYTRRQYVARAPDRNPYGAEEEPAKFTEFDVFTKIRVLQQLTKWTMINPDRIRERMEEQKDTEQTIWRIEPFGWDSTDRIYIVLDDNRLYRQTDPPPLPLPAPKSKKNSKKAKAAARSSKRRKTETVDSEADPADDTILGDNASNQKEDNGLGGMNWECLAITLQDFTAFLSTIEKTRDLNEKTLRKRIIDDVLPILEKEEEARKRKAAQQERELLNLEKLATAKRSSRIAGKMEQQKHEEEIREAERKTQADLLMAKKEQEKWQKLEKERESRMVTREQRLKEREARRILHEDELANLSEDSRKIDAGAGRLSERHLRAEIEKKKQALEELADEDDWIFDCICGVYGQVDDGTHSIACDKCNIWQHSKCAGVRQIEAERDDFHFICKTCIRREKDAERAKTHPHIKIKLNRPGSSSSHLALGENSTPVAAKPLTTNGSSSQSAEAQRAAQNMQPSATRPSPHGVPKMATWQPSQSHSPQNVDFKSPSSSTPRALPSQNNGSRGSPVKQRSPILPPPVARPLSAHAFSSPHPNSPTNLPPPGQPPVHTFMNGHGLNYSKPAPDHNTITPHKTQGSPGPITNNLQGNSINQTVNGYRPVSSDGGPIGSKSANLSSPLAGAPVLTPISKSYTITHTPSNSQGQMSTPNMHTWQPTGSSPPRGAPSPFQGQPVQIQDPAHTSNLPPIASGISPKKHSPPRSTASNGSFSSTTPSILPPITSLSPSHQVQNLSPPVKVSEPERRRPNSRAISP